LSKQGLALALLAAVVWKAGGKMKDIASNLWKAIHPGADNASGFSARPAGGRGRTAEKAGDRHLRRMI
jgi:hypothetical protein